MSIKQIIECDICGKIEKEETVGAGFVGWGSLNGIVLDGVDNPTLCPEHLNSVADALENIKMNHEWVGGI